MGIGQCRDPLALPESGAIPVCLRMVEDAPPRNRKQDSPVLQVRPMPAVEMKNALLKEQE
ncbi:hypothetical protein [Methylobacter sp. BlB1]|uniref:hypothetical protein n=1 Tax=Methylobacter sp. BlB1 TaxID=2785914 RepID=UPI00189535E6|nr:hypothetical protein [Methylobacter sp. BlB1]MBF6649670.1 hypothetical protein [Methylobacter sp. BlB1]